MAYLLYPDIFRNKVAFTSEDNLWIYHRTDKSCRLVLSNFGTITHPRFSPDGKKIAFRCTKGSDTPVSEVYIISEDSSELKRITYFGTGMTDVVCWKDNHNLVVISDEGSPFTRETISYLFDTEDLSYEPMNLGPASAILYTEHGTFLVRGLQDLNYWKHYKGGLRGKVYFDRGNKGDYKLFLQIDYTVDSPVYLKNRLYFLTDTDGTSNVYSVNLDGKDMKQHTKFSDFYVRNLRSDGSLLTFHRGGEIFLLDPKNDKVEKCPITPPLTNNLKERRFIENDKFIEMFQISPNGQDSAFVIRGQAFRMNPKAGPVEKINADLKGRTRLVNFGPEGKSVYFVNDASSEDEIYVSGIEGKAKKILGNFGTLEGLFPSPDGRKLAISNNRNQFGILDVKSGKFDFVDENKFGIIDEATWHPSGNYVAISYPGNGSLSHIEIVNAKTGKKTTATSQGSIDYSPSFDSTGKYMYYLSERALDPVYDKIVFDLGFPKAAKPHVITLDKNEPDPVWARQMDERTDEGGKSVSDIDLADLTNRSSELPVNVEEYHRIVGLSDSALLLKFPVEGVMKQQNGGPRSDGSLVHFDLKTGKEKTIFTRISDFKVSKDEKKIMIRRENHFTVENLSSALKNHVTSGDSKEEKEGRTEIDLKRIKCDILPADEWRQMFFETWRLMRENYWKEEKISKFWDKVRKKYLPLVDMVSSRYEMSDLLKEMQGETGTSHSYERGGEIYRSSYPKIGKLGCSFKYSNGKYLFDQIYCGDPSNIPERSPLLASGVDIKSGDELLGINGHKVGKDYPPGKALEDLPSTVITLETRRGSKTLKQPVRSLGSELNLIYRNWVENNRKFVRQKFGDKVGYIHIPDMMAKGFSEFHRQYIFEWDKPSIIVDVRFNGGGHVSHLLLEKISRRLIGFDLPRRGPASHYPLYAVRGGIVAVTNEFAGSDGDIFSHSFKLMGLGELIGERTWGGVIGINPRRQLVDRTMITQPQYAFWFKDVGFGVENYGTDPTIRLDNVPGDYLRNRDPQLEKAGQIALKLSEKAMTLPSKE